MGRALMAGDTIALVPARSGSKGFPGKNIEPFLGRPLLDWSLEAGELMPSVSTTVLSSDSPKYLERAQLFSKAVSLVRPRELSLDHSPMSGVIAHAAQAVTDGEAKFLLLLDPTSPVRNPSEIESALNRLRSSPELVGAVSISEPHFNMRWVGVSQDQSGEITRSFLEGQHFTARQQVPRMWRMNGTFYIWRLDYAKVISDPWLEGGPHLGIEIPEERAFSIDTEVEFKSAEVMLRSGLVDWEMVP